VGLVVDDSVYLVVSVSSYASTWSLVLPALIYVIEKEFPNCYCQVVDLVFPSLCSLHTASRNKVVPT